MMSDTQSGQIARMIQATAMAACKDQARPQISGILIEMDQEVWQMTATDSYMLVTTQTTAPENSPTGATTVDAKWMNELAKQMGKRHTATRITFTPDMITAELITNSTIHATLSTPTNSRTDHGKFPDWRKLWPHTTTDRPTYSPVAFNPQFLATVCKSAAIVANKENAPITHEHTDPMKPNTFTLAHDGTVWNALLMPVRT